ncbi:unnamed protein product [Hymenolepis diminuta]|uniref:Uncharacterized protein n=1 Tax=Hymenolepis diminuta TaxID=6216 RepID=A0A564YE61_HYMDI|nr:unnamed protein product [Hymenolepis diminuta]
MLFSAASLFQLGTQHKTNLYTPTKQHSRPKQMTRSLCEKPTCMLSTNGNNYQR